MQGCVMWWTYSIFYKNYKKVIPMILPNMCINIYIYEVSNEFVDGIFSSTVTEFLFSKLKQINKCLNQYILYLPRNCL